MLMTGCGSPPQQAQRETSGISHRMSQQQYSNRSREQVARFFAGTELVEPSLVSLSSPGRTGAVSGARGFSPVYFVAISVAWR